MLSLIRRKSPFLLAILLSGNPALAGDPAFAGVFVAPDVTASNSVTLTNKTISGASNTLSAIANASLTNSSVTLGAQSVALGATMTTANLTSQINAFTTSLSGAAPASGGGTSNFLRADGTWAAPAGGGGGSPGGSTTQCQYNNAGSFGGVTGCTSDGTAITLVAPVLGTPASGTLTNATGLPISSGVSGLGTGMATWLATPSSANLITAVTDETGTGALAFATSPTLSGTIGGTLTFSGGLTLSSALTYGGVTLSNAVTGTGNMVLSAAPTFTGVMTAASMTASGTVGTANVTVYQGATYKGGTSASQSVTLESTSGTGTSDSLSIKTGSQVTAIGVDTNQLITLPRIATDATHTDTSICQDTTTHALYSGSGTLGVCLGTSSVRYKHAVVEQGDGLEQILALQPKNYFYNAGYGDNVCAGTKDSPDVAQIDGVDGNGKELCGGREQYGFLAEDVAGVLPKLTSLDDKGQPNTVDILGMVPVLVKAVQQMQGEIDALKH